MDLDQSPLVLNNVSVVQYNHVIRLDVLLCICHQGEEYLGMNYYMLEHIEMKASIVDH